MLQIINPEDVDPNVGRFRNLVSTVVIPAKVGKKLFRILENLWFINSLLSYF